MDTFGYYLIGVNVVGFFIYLINMWLYSNTEKGQVDKLLTILSLIGGSFGILFAIVIFDRKAVKETMMSRVFIACVFVIQMIILLVINGHHAEHITLDFWTFFVQHKIFLIYLCIINFITFIAFAIDKINAVKHRTRIRIVTLLILAYVGGSLGALIAMYLLRHKTLTDYFTVGIPLIILMQIFVLFYAMNIGW